MKRWTLAILSFVAIAALNADAVDFASSRAALDELKAANPGIGFYTDGGPITRIYGVAFGSGSSPANTAEKFRNDYSAALGMEASELVPESGLPGVGRTQPLMYNRDTGEYKFTLVYYSQYRDGVPVFRSDLRLLVRNEPGYPLVLASSSLHDLGNFRAEKIAPDKSRAESAIKSSHPGMSNFSEPRLVIWAGIDDQKAEPATAIEMIADNNKAATPEFEKQLYLVDARSGEILYSENMILDVNVTGNVSGRATQGLGADICGPEDPTPLPYARVYIQGGNEAYADADGNFEIINSGNSPVNVVSEIKGNWFNVYNEAGSDAQLVLNVTPPGPANFMHNSANTSEYNRAEVNGYVHANVVRDFTLTYNPLYPTIHNQHQFPVYVNIASTCNAYYDYNSINFFRSGGSCPNTAFSTVVYHEYGHHLVSVGGSGQGAYGEGMGDVMGVLITDDSGLAYGFYSNCNEPLRNADNSVQYPCSGEIHDCGRLLSGCVWDTRQALVITHPSDYRDILSNLAVNAILLHGNSTEITPSITIDYLTLDDDDGNINNGTPHWNEICSGFGAHNMDCPELLMIGFNYPNGLPPNLNPDGGTTIRVEVYGIGGTPQPGTGMFHYNGGSGWVSVAMEIISDNVYDAVFPAFPCGTTVHYYFSAEATNGFENVDPPGAPGTSFSAISATGFIYLFQDDFSGNTGWSGYGGQAEWTRGAATGGYGNDSHGGPDPSTDHSPTGDNYLIGNDLGAGSGGDYNAYIGATYWLTSPAINCSGVTGVTLTFYRWLGVEQPAYDHAYFQVYNGSSWITLYQNDATIDDASWVEMTYDVSAYANNNSNFRIRFGLGSTDGSWQYCGWNVDDVVLWTYECGPVVTGTLAGTVTDGVNPISGVSVHADDGAGHVGNTSTAGDGTYSMDLEASTYTVTYTRSGYNDVVIPGVVITEGNTTIQDVVMEANNAEIPTLTEWGMILMSLLLLAFGTVAVVRRRRALASKG